MTPGAANPNPGNEPELQFLLADTFQSLWKSLSDGLYELFFPKKLPPLTLESKPIPVKDIWGLYNYKRMALWFQLWLTCWCLG